MNYLKGYRTYIGIAVLVLIGVLFKVGYLDDRAYELLLVAGGALAVYGRLKASTKNGKRIPK